MSVRYSTRDLFLGTFAACATLGAFCAMMPVEFLFVSLVLLPGAVAWHLAETTWCSCVLAGIVGVLAFFLCLSLALAFPGYELVEHPAEVFYGGVCGGLVIGLLVGCATRAVRWVTKRKSRGLRYVFLWLAVGYSITAVASFALGRRGCLVCRYVYGRGPEMDCSAICGTHHNPPVHDFASASAVADASAPNDVLIQWAKLSAPIGPSQRVNIRRDAIDRLARTGIFDCEPYIIDDTLTSALRKAPQLKWLRIGDHATPADLRWISDLSELRGLSLRYARLRDAEFQALGRLVDLQWLDLHGAELPPRSGTRLPTLPRLEVLLVDFTDFGNGPLDVIGRFPRLRALRACHSALTDDGLSNIIDANPNLEHLNLGYCSGITTESLSEIAKLHHLKSLYIGLTTLVDEMGMDAHAELQWRLPRCYIYVGD